MISGKARRVLELAPPLLIFLLNVYICRGLFTLEYLRHMGSIEPAYYGITRWIMSHWRDLSWFPLWYGGIPYQDTYPPLLHWVVALVAWLRGVSPAAAHHWTTAILYCLGPVTLYALMLRFSGSRGAAFAGGLMYSVLCPSAWLVPVIANDLGSVFYPRRLQAMVFYGETPHIAALTVLPLAVLLVDFALRKKTALWFCLAVLGTASVALMSWLAAFTLAWVMLSYFLARWGAADWDWRDVGLAVCVAIAAYCLAMPWIPPSTIAIVHENARLSGGDFTETYEQLPIRLPLVLMVLILLKAAIRRLPMHLQFAAFFAVVMSVLTLFAGWWRIDIVPQSLRYQEEMEMALLMLVVFTAQALLVRAPSGTGVAIMALLMVALIQPARITRRYARNTLIRSIDIHTTIEWKTARWLDEHLRTERVFVPGSTSFWLNAFTDTPEITGGFEEGITDPLIRHAQYFMTTGEGAGGHDPEYSIFWLQALGVGAVAVSGPASSEVYKPFRNPWKFEGVLETLWRDGDDVIYRVPHRSFAHVLRRSDLPPRPPVTGKDAEPLRNYVRALEDPALPFASFRWTTVHSAHIAAEVGAGQVILVQIPWSHGWRAVVNGNSRPVERDPVGMMVIDPAIAGKCEMDLIYDGGPEMKTARAFSLLTAIGLLGLTGYAFVRRKSPA